MKESLPLALLVVLMLPVPTLAQTTFQRTYGGVHDDVGQSVVQTADGGYVITGQTNSFGAGHDDVYLVKTDASGDTIWTHTYGGADNDLVYSVAQTADGGYIVTGWTESFGAGYYDFYLVRTDATGDTVWTRTWGGADWDLSWSVAQTADGGYIVAGYTNSFGAGDYDAWLIKADASGDTTWTRTYGGADSDRSHSVAQTADSGYVIAGETWSYGAGSGDFWLIKADAIGDTVWTRTYGGAERDWAKSVALTADGGYIVTGWTESYGAGESDVYLVKTDASGDTIWTRTFGGTDYDKAYSVAQTADGGCIVTGASGYDAWLIKTDASGDTMWTRTYGDTLHDGGSSVTQTADGGYVITGHTESFGAGGSDVWLIKTDSLGRAGVAEQEPVEIERQTGPTVMRASDLARVEGRILDAQGRDVTEQNGALRPGIYFVRPEGPRNQGVKGAVRKVILTR